MKTTSSTKEQTEISDDFLNAQPALSADGRCGAFYYDEVSAGTCTNTSIAGRSGVVRMAMATPAASVTNWLGCAGVQVTERSLNPIFEVELFGASETDHRIIFGFHQIAINTGISADTNQSANGAFFRKQAANNFYECVTRSASGSENIVQLTDVLANAYHRFRVVLVDATAMALFFVDSVLVAAVTTGVPTSSTRLTVAIGHGVTSTVARTLELDFFGLG